MGKYSSSELDLSFEIRMTEENDLKLLFSNEDNEEDVEAIYQQFKRLQSIAQKRGYAVAIGHPYPETLIALKRWVKVADKLNIKIVSVQELLEDTGQQDHKQDQTVQSKGEEKKVTLAPSTTPTTRLNP